MFMKKLIFLLYFIIITPLFALEIDQNFLKQFEGIAIKTITKSEIMKEGRNQHQFNGISSFQDILGEERKYYDTHYIYFDNDIVITASTKSTWYFKGKSNKKSYNLYYRTNEAIYAMGEDDLLFLAKIDDSNLLAVITHKDSSQTKELLKMINDGTINENSKTLKKIQNIINSIKQKTYKEDIKNLNEEENDNVDEELEPHNISIYKNTKTQKIVIIGKANKIYDADSIILSELFYTRLFGIDAPESKQICKDKNNKDYYCGEEATKFIKKLIGKSYITCINQGLDYYNRFLFICNTPKYNINNELVKNGHAICTNKKICGKEELYAKKNNIGIWQGKFQTPKDWRRTHKLKK